MKLEPTVESQLEPGRVFRGALAAYRGYRLQALYTLSRILGSGVPDKRIFKPEGYEDLVILGEDRRVLEAVEVKAHGKNLTLSDFSPQKPESFLRRAVRIANEYPTATIRIVSFGPIGPEMSKAWELDGDERTSVRRKMAGYGFSSADVDTLFSSVILREVDERSLRDDVFAYLRQGLTGGDPERAFDLLNHWLYRASEEQEEITCASLRVRISDVGRYLAERAHHHQEWFTSIVPLEDSVISAEDQELLTNEYYQGVAARFQHILASADVVRDSKLGELEESFHRANIVVLHGASGQGKSTLAYRYLHDSVAEIWRFEVRAIKDRLHALKVARALAGYANALDVPIFVYVDVAPRDKEWLELVKELAQLSNLRVLVTIREEDFRRASVAESDFTFEEVELRFDEREAKGLYSQLESKREPEQFLTFEEAWSHFDSDGPLLEFVYLVTQNESLKERLVQQIKRLQDRVRSGDLRRDELRLLKLVSIGSAYGARLSLPALIDHLELPEPIRTIELLEKEYLLRRSPDDLFIEGLHPLRSDILVDLLTDEGIYPWIGLARECVPIIDEDDLEIFLLHAFSRRTAAAKPLFETLLECQPRTWAGLVGVLRAVLWLGVHNYVDNNRQLIDETVKCFGLGWSFFMDFDLAGVSSEFVTSWWSDLSFIPESTKKTIQSIQERQTPKEEAFVYAIEILARWRERPTQPESVSDWAGVAEVSFWIGHLNITSSLLPFVLDLNLDQAIDELPLNVLGDVVLASSTACPDHSNKWLKRNGSRLLARFREERDIVKVEDDGKSIRLHFIVDYAKMLQEERTRVLLFRNRGDILHELALGHIEVLRKLVPDRKEYGSKGYGQRIGTLEFPFDDTDKKGIPRRHLPPAWPTRVNSFLSQIGIRKYRPETWKEYALQLYQLRQDVLDIVAELERGLIAYFRKRSLLSIRDDYMTPNKWEEFSKSGDLKTLLPRCAVDEWGFVREDTSNRSEGYTPKQVQVRFSIWRYKELRKALRDFHSSLVAFLDQSNSTLVVNPILGRVRLENGRHSHVEQAKKQGVESKPELSTHNFAEAIKNLAHLQQHFRAHFSQYFDERELDRFEKRETKALLRIWSLWYQFAFHPSQIVQDPIKKSSDKLLKAQRQIRSSLRRRLRELSRAGIKATIVTESVPWENQPSIWISYTVENALSYHEAFDIVVDTIRKAIGSPENQDLRRYALDFWWPNLMVLGLIEGKSLGQTARRLPLYTLLTESLSWFNYSPVPVPPEIWEVLGLEVWTHESLEMVDGLQSSVYSLYLLVSHASDFNRLPELDELGNSILRAHLEAHSTHIARQLEQVLDIVVRISRHLATSDWQKHPALGAAAQALLETKDTIPPCDGFDGTLRMGLAELMQWVHRLETALEQSELVRLHILADVLNEASAKPQLL